MLGLLYGLFCGSAVVIDKTAETLSDMNKRDEALKNGKDWYLDSNLQERNTVTNHKQRTSYDFATGDIVRKDLKTGETINISEINRNKQIQELKNNNSGKTVIEFPSENVRLMGYKGYSDCKFFKDIYNGKIYAKRSFAAGYDLNFKGYGSYYMDLETNKLVRPTDECLLDKNVSMEIVDKIMKIVNTLNPVFYISGRIMSYQIHFCERSGKYYIK